MTKGEKSTLRYGLSPTDSLTQARTMEFTNVMHFLHVEDFKLYDFPDSGLESVATDVEKCIDSEITTYKPTHVITYEPAGVYGHPDHVVVSKLVTNVVDRERIIGNKISLIYSTVPSFFKVDSQTLNMPGNYKMKPLVPNHYLFLNPIVLINKLKALSLHRSQFDPKSTSIIDFLRIFYLIFEYFHIQG